MDYNARIELDSRDFDDSAVDVLMDVVEPYAGTVARAVHGGRVELILTTPADNLRQATITALSVVLSTGYQVYALEVLPTDEFHRRIDATPVPELLSVPQAAEELGVSRQRALQLVNAGQLDSVKVGDTWVVPRSAVVARAAGRSERQQAGQNAWTAILDGVEEQERERRRRRGGEGAVEVVSYP